jgi:hypothetical protein
MTNYIHYTDPNAIKLGNLAWEIGDFNCALHNYKKALHRLGMYQGDQMQPMLMAGELKNR